MDTYTADQIAAAAACALGPEEAESFAHEINSGVSLPHRSGELRVAFGWFFATVDGQPDAGVFAPRALVRAHDQSEGFEFGFTYADELPELRQAEPSAVRPLATDKAQRRRWLSWLEEHPDHADELIRMAEMLRRFATPTGSPLPKPVTAFRVLA